MVSLCLHGLILVCWDSLGAFKDTAKAVTNRKPATVVPLLSQQRVQRLTAGRTARQYAASKRKKEQEKPKLEREPVQKRAQIVEINPPQNQSPPKDAKFVSEYNSSVKKQQVSSNKRSPSQRMVKSDRRLISPGKDLDGSRAGRPNPSDQAKRRRKRPQSDKTASGRKRPNAEKRRKQLAQKPRQQPTVARPLPKGDGKFNPNQRSSESRRATAGKGKTGSSTGASQPQNWRSLLPSLGPQDALARDGSIDHVKDVERGEGTFLNTRAYKHAWFFNRVKRRVRREWRAAETYRRNDPSGRIYGVRDRYTIVDVTLSSEGSLEGVSVKKDSGVAVLDEAAVTAFRTAQPFPNPPAGLRDPDGRIRFQFGFFLEIGGSRFKLFR
ncbi:MAG: TonB family protein [Bradymonadia bacterium]